jgi:hypothetical protein
MSASAKDSDPPDDTSIPVLTERLTLPPLELDTTLPQEPKARPGGAPLPLDTSLPSNFPPKAAPAPAKAAAPAPARPAPAPAPAAARPAPAPAPAAARPAPAPAPATAPPARATAPAESSTTQHWTRIELELRASILQAIADALPQQIDTIVRSRMAGAVERLMEELAAETRLAVAASLRDIVDQAVRAELARLRTHKR